MNCGDITIKDKKLQKASLPNVFPSMPMSLKMLMLIFFVHLTYFKMTLLTTKE